MNKKIFIARFCGFCTGVTKAVKETEEVLKSKKNVYCIGDLIHNSFVIEELRDLGLKVVDDVSQIPENANFIVRAHGIPVETLKQLKKKNCRIFDFTCQILKRVHHLIEELKKQKFKIIIIGNPKHPEVKAFISHAGKDAMVIFKDSDLENIKVLPPCAVICQSTIDKEMFLRISRKLIEKTRKILIINTICGEVEARRKEAIKLAKNSKMVIIVGDKKSSNTKHLAKILRKFTRAEIVSDAEELEKIKIEYPIFLTSGASTPMRLIKEIAKKL